MRIVMTGGHISLLFIISSILFSHSSAAGFKELLDFAGKFTDAAGRIWDYKEKHGSDQPKKLPHNLEAAVKKYQRANGFRATGKIDDATVSLIKHPRCGVDDDSTVSTLRWQWPEEKKELTYAFYNGGKVKAAFKAVFSRAFARWEKVTGLSFSETASFHGSDIVIAFRKINKKDVAAVSGIVKTRGVMVFEEAEKWGPPEGAGEVDLETAVMHQIGHVVGLGHTTIDEAAVMFPIMERGKRKLHFGNFETVRIQQLFNITSNAATSTGDSI